ncbi:hypothetical protein V1498_01715 [Peribacillus sp. SCS-26]|uniref:hypothetical protein n=1 Tax=Paraperibacillus marinus TaxID=3115295 RepID=UPI003906D235
MNIGDYMPAIGMMFFHYLFEGEKFKGRPFYHHIIEYATLLGLIVAVDKIVGFF